MTTPSRPYQPELIAALRDPREAAEYLNAALEDGTNDVFLLALRNVAEAYGISTIARDTNLNRESMYRMLSSRGNPRLSSLASVLSRVGLKLTVQVKTLP